MKISRISKIKNHRIFREFSWPDDLTSFAQFNVIYGWNGTGKTTVSSLFEHVQDKRDITEGEVAFELDNGNKISGSNLSKITTPAVRVFNRSFVKKTIESVDQDNVTPIYFIGEENIGKQKEIEQLKKELESANKTLDETDNNKRNADKALDDFCIGKAKLIKEALLGSAQHATYDKRRYDTAAKELKGKVPRPTKLSDEEKNSLRIQKELQAKNNVARINFSCPDLNDLYIKTSDLLKRMIASQVIEALANDADVASWVKRGLELHEGEYQSGTCRFCGNVISGARREELEGHFNDAFNEFQKDIEDLITEINGHMDVIGNVVFSDESRLYENLTAKYKNAVTAAKEIIKNVNNELSKYKNALSQKMTSPFKVVTIEKGEPQSLLEAIDSLNAFIDEHNEITENLNDKIDEAYKLLEQDYVLETYTEYDELCKTVIERQREYDNVKNKPEEISKQIEVVEREIIEHRRPAEELNKELKDYLGRDELQFQVKDTGYVLTRAGIPAKDLSEGERTAITFLYFLKSLEDKKFDIKNGVVVIDDPVSSLDANALFAAFGYMKERTKECQQLFVLTHNFAFFRQIKNWFHHLPGQKKNDITQRPGRFYALLAIKDGDQRNAKLSSIDPLLEEFESEYHFLFRHVYDVANSNPTGSELSQYYGMPNIARRLLETFFSYRYPDCCGDLRKRFERVDYDVDKKTKILRLLHTYSHSGGVSEPEHDPTILGETVEVMKCIVEMMKKVDSNHFDGMVKLISTDRETE